MNQVGTLLANADSEGNFVEGCLSGPFGDGQLCTSDYDYTETRFTDKLRDRETGNDYFVARYCNSTLGRFTSPDPSGLGYADPGNPQSLNAYSYVRNNPLSNVDPTGLCEDGVNNGSFSDPDVSPDVAFCDNTEQQTSQAFQTAYEEVNVHAEIEYGSAFLGVYTPVSVNVNIPYQYANAPSNNTRNCPPVPPSPPGVSLKANMAAAADDAFLPDPIELLLFRNRVNYGGSQDYKTQGPQYEPFGNFNYGATGTSMNIPAFTLYRAAGRAQRGHPSSPQFGGDPGSLPSIFLNPNGGVAPYGADPDDQKYINMGIQYAQMGCGG